MRNDRFKQRTLQTVTPALALAACTAMAGDRDDDDDYRRLTRDSLYDPGYNVYRGTDPRCYHDWASAEREGNRVLICSRTAGPRHANLGPRLAAGLNPLLGPGNAMQTH